MGLPVAGRMQHLQVAQLISTAFAAPGHVMRVPAAFQGDGLLANRAFAILLLPEGQQSGGQVGLHRGLYAVFQSTFPTVGQTDWPVL